jgi:hypothetical protein
VPPDPDVPPTEPVPCELATSGVPEQPSANAESNNQPDMRAMRCEFKRASEMRTDRGYTPVLPPER